MGELIHQLLAVVETIWQRRWLVLKVAAVCCGLTWLLLFVIPSQYEAQARVFVDVRTALKPVLKGIAVEEDVDSEVTRVREALLSHPTLEDVARKNSLIDAEHTLEYAVARLQSKIDVKVERGIGARNAEDRGATVYSISYRDRDFNRSVAVVSTLLDSFERGTLTGNRGSSNQAQQFLTAQIAEYEKRLADAEGRLAEFKKRNVGMIPGDKGDYFSRLDKEMSDLQVAETNLAIAVSRREALQRQLNGTKPYLAGTSVAGAGGSGGSATDISTRLQENEARLAEMLTRYTDKHPEVIALKHTVEEQRAQQARELAELEKGGTGTGSIRSLAANPVYQSVQVQLNQADIELAALRGAITQHNGEIANLRRVVNSAPEVEAEYSRLNRDYGVTKAQYEQLVQRLEQARVSENAAAQGAVRFEVIDPPRAERRPIFPNRPLIALAGLAIAFAAGILAALALAMSKPTFSSVGALQELGVPVLGSISMQISADGKAALKRDQRLALICAAALIVVGLAMARFADPIARRMYALPVVEQAL